MRKVNKQITNYRSHFCLTAIVFAVFAFFAVDVNARSKIAVLTPEKNAVSRNFAEKLETAFPGEFKILNGSSSEAAFLSGSFENAFNLTVEESKNIGAAIGCNYFLLVKTALQRRSSFGRPQYFEAYSVIYTISSRTGRLIFWKLDTFEADQPSEAETKLLASVNDLAKEISGRIKNDEEDQSRADNRRRHRRSSFGKYARSKKFSSASAV